MSVVVRNRVLLFLLSVILVPILTALVILFARGYRPNFQDGQFSPTGLLVAQSYPDGAQIYINGQLRSATNTTLNLAPGEYEVEIKKEGFTSWKKHLVVQAEIVTRAPAWLFPSVPSLKAITSAGADNPVLSPESSKVVFSSASAGTSRLYLLDLSESPLGLLNREARLISSSTIFDYSKSQLTWSPDSRQVLATATGSALLIDTTNQQTTDVSATVANLLESWQVRENVREQQKFATLPPQLQNIFATSAANLVWSPKENKVLYTATASAIIPDNLIKPLPGSSTQPQSRQIEPGKLYIYDLEEDRNFIFSYLPAPSPSPTPRARARAQVQTTPQPRPQPVWFPTSEHLMYVQDSKVIVVEYDGQNPTVVYAGPMQDSIAYPYPSGHQMLILTNLNPALAQFPNLYAVDLR